MRDPINAPTDVDDIAFLRPFFLLFFLLYVRHDKTFWRIRQNYSRA